MSTAWVDCVFGKDADRNDLHGRDSSEMIASPIGHEKDEIELYRQ
jgi:hypothetical protein